MEYERVQIMLLPEQRDAVRSKAKELGVSMSEVVRRALAPVVDEERAAAADGDPLFSIFGIAEGLSGPGNLDDEIDEVVYGRSGGIGQRARLSS